MSDEVKYGWWSEKMAKRGGRCCVYRSADSPNGVVYITEVTTGPDPACSWDDIKFVGMVSNWIREGTPLDFTCGGHQETKPLAGYVPRSGGGCPDCNGKGTYTGFMKVEKCDRCNGTGSI